MAMQAIQNSKFNCYNFSNINDNDIIDWTSNTNTSEVINVWLYPTIFLKYTQLNDTHYQWCGAMFLFVEYFAKFTKTRIKISPSINLDNLFGSMLDINPGNLPHFVVGAVDPNQYCKMHDMIENGFGTKLEEHMGVTSPFTTFYLDTFIASTVKGHQTMFKIFESMDHYIYLSVFTSILILSLVVGSSEGSLNAFLSTLWSYTSVILSGGQALRMKSSVDRLLSGVWLISCTVLLAAFSGLLRELMIKSEAIYCLDSWNDLSLSTRIKTIQAFDSSGLASYIKDYQDEPLAKVLSDKTEMIKLDDFEIYNKSFDKDLDYNGFKNGYVAYSENENYLNIFKQNLIARYGLIEDQDFHISRTDDLSSQPISFVTNKIRIDNLLTSQLNLVIEIFRESGIYSELEKRTLYQNKSMMHLYTSQNKYQHDDLLLHHFAGLFILIMIGNLFSIGALAFENFFTRANCMTSTSNKTLHESAISSETMPGIKAPESDDKTRITINTK